MPNYRVKLKVPNLNLDAMREKLEAMADVRLVEMKHERLAEVRELLGTGRAPGTGYEYLGKDQVARDARLMAMDPRMRARDSLGDGTITGASAEAAKSSADGAAEHAAKLVGQGGEAGLDAAKEEFTKTLPGAIASMAIESAAGVVLGAVTELVIDRLTAAEIPGADYDKRNQTTGDTVLEVAKDLGKAAAKKGVAALPLVGTALSAAATVKSGLRTGEFEHLKKETAGQGQAGSDATSQSLMSGMAKHNKDQMVDRIVETGARATSDVLTGVSLGVGAAATTAVRVTGVASSVAKTAVNVGLAIGRSGVEQETRKQARMPRRPAERDAAHEQAVDQANKALTDLTARSGKRAKATLDYLAEGQMSVDKELYTNRQVQKNRTKDNSAKEGTPDQEHTLRPSQVAQLGRQEKARLRQRERLGADRTWDPKREKQQAEEAEEGAKQEKARLKQEQQVAQEARKTVRKAQAKFDKKQNSETTTALREALAHEASLAKPKPPAPPPMPRQAKPAAMPSQGGRLKDALHIQEEKLYEKTN